MKSTILPLLLLGLILGGCLAVPGDRMETGGPLTASIFLEEGLEASYAFGPEYPHLRPVNLTIRIESTQASPRITYDYRHEDCPECDAATAYVLGSDGSWSNATFACQAPYPDTRAESECYDYLGGYSNDDGTRGAFFGISLVSGIPADANSTIHRAFAYGTTTVMGHFRIQRIADNQIQVTAADAKTAIVPFSGLSLEPFECSIFNGRVVVDTDLGLPTSCMVDETNDDGSTEAYGWTLTHTNAQPDRTPFSAADLPLPPVLHPDGKRFPPRSGDEGLPFGLYEAIDHAAANDARVAEFLQREGTHLSSSQLTFHGGTATGICEYACLRTENRWRWTVGLQEGHDRLHIEVRKNISHPSNLETFNLDVVELEVLDHAYGAFPTNLPRFDSLWSQAQQSTGMEPMILTYQPTGRGEDPTINLEPFIFVGFQGPGWAGFVPGVWFRVDGTIQLWMASGATPSDGSAGASWSPQTIEGRTVYQKGFHLATRL